MVEYKNAKSIPNNRRYTKNTRKKSYDKSTGQSEDHVPWICLAQKISQQCTTGTHIEAVHRQGVLFRPHL